MKLQSITRQYDIAADIPARNDIELLRDNDNLLYLIGVTYKEFFDEKTGEFGLTGEKTFQTLIIDRERLPLPEKDYLKDYNDLVNLPKPPILKPVEPIQPDNPDVISEIKKFIFWFLGHPSQRGKVYFEKTEQTILQDFFRPTPQPFFPYVQQKFYWPYNNGLFSEFAELVQFPDFVFFQTIPDIATDNGELLTRDNFQKAITGRTPAEIVAFLQWYDIFSDLRDKMFATYELFRTEQYDTIAHYDIATQYVAINNYFATFRFLGKAKKNAAPKLDYKSQKYVLTNVSKALNIPPEIMTVAKKPNIPKAAPTTKEKTSGDKTPIMSKEIIKQRTQHGQQLELYFGNYIGQTSNITQTTITKGLILDWGQKPVEFQQIQYEILNYAQRNDLINCYDLAKEINAAQSKEQLQTIFEKTSCTVPISYLLKKVYGKVSGENREKFIKILDEMPAELFIFNSTYKDDKTGKVVRVDEKTMNKYKKKGYKNLFLYGKRFEPEQMIYGEMRNGKIFNWEQNIRINPIFFANMVDADGNITNYEQLTDSFMSWIRNINKKDKISYPVYEILTRERDKCFAKVKKEIRNIKSTARKNKEPQPTPAEISELKQTGVETTIQKDKLQELVENNANIQKTAYAKTRTRQAIETALQKIQEGGFLIESYKTIGDAWKIKFLPS